MTELVLYDDAAARAFEPFALTRPVSELRVGTHIVRERWEVAVAAPPVGSVVAAHLASFEEFDAPPVLAPQGVLAPGSILANSRFAPALAQALPADAWSCDGRVAAVRLTKAQDLASLASGALSLEELVEPGAAHAEIQGWWLDHIWDAIRFLGPMLTDDISRWATSVPHAPWREGVRGSHLVAVEEGAIISPHVVIDASAGPVLIRRGATIASFTTLVGPCFVGIGTQLLGGKVGGSSIGESCRIHGEMSTCVVLGHANKSHDGFVGHSMLGRWVNLGASTVTSNLKNTYGTVQLWTPKGNTDSGLQFLGSMIGDHAKTAIGTRLTTGCLIGAAANVVLDGLSPKVIGPFAWGGGGGHEGDVYDIAKFLVVAERAMQRRSVVLTPRQRACLRAAYAARWRVSP